jgi:type VI secretion system secreted protein Hcp
MLGARRHLHHGKGTIVKTRQIVTWCVRGTIVLAVIVAAVLQTHSFRSTALAQGAKAGAPTGCPAVPGNFSGILASVPGLSIQSSANYPANSFPVTSMQWGVGRGISSPTSGGRESSAPSVSEVVITRLSDQNDPLLVHEALVGQATDWTLYLYHSVDQAGNPACESYTLNNVLISGYSTSSGGGQPSESLSLNFTKFTVHHFGSNTSVTYDLATNQTT